ncbi:MAG: GNAT family N-acetyltransferase [Nitrososphaerales archaeon]
MPNRIEMATSDDVPEILNILEKKGLTKDGIKDAQCWIIKLNNKIIGSIGLEVWGKQGLLRSLAVEEKSRKKGLGRSLVFYVLEVARQKNLEEVFLLSEASAEYYLRFGFEYYERKLVSGDVLKSAEFRGACLESAKVMRIQI